MAFSDEKPEIVQASSSAQIVDVHFASATAFATDIASGGDLDVSAATTAASKWFVKNARQGGTVTHGQRTTAGAVTTKFATINYTTAGVVTLTAQA